MMSLALHTRLHWDCLRKNAAFPRFRAFARRPVVWGVGGVTRAIPQPAGQWQSSKDA